MSDAFVEARALLMHEVVEVFADRGIRLVRRGPDLPALDSVVDRAIVFEGGELRGVIALAAQTVVWRNIVPKDLRPLPDELLTDMVGELCNLVVGRLQNRLLRRGVYIASGTPASECASRLVKGHGGTTRRSVEVFEEASGLIAVRFEMRFRDRFVLLAEDQPQADGLSTNGADVLWF